MSAKEQLLIRAPTNIWTFLNLRAFNWLKAFNRLKAFKRLKAPGKLKASTLFFCITISFIFNLPLLAESPVSEIPDKQNESLISEADNQPLLASQKQQFTIGILSQTAQDSIENSPWQLSFERLNHHPKYHFSVLFLNTKQLNHSLENDELDFVICDAINYLVLEKQYGVLRLLTRAEQHSDSFITSEGLSVYTLNNNTSIIQLQDLKDKKIGVIDINSSISWLFLEKFLSKHDLLAYTDNKLKTISDMSQSLALLQAGTIDAIISKSGLMEQNFPQSIDNLRQINPRRSWQMPFMHSSVLIPEWALAKTWFIDNKTGNQIVSLLLNQHKIDSSEEDPYLLSQYYWGAAQNYSIINELFLLPEQLLEEKSIEQNVFPKKIQYWVSFAIICFLVLILIMYLRSSRDLNNRLTASKESLEQEIKERHHAQELALTHQAELAHVARLSTMGEMASGLAHELNQPLSAIQTYVQGCIRRINMGNTDLDAIVNALQLTAQQAERAGGIIRRLRSFVRKGESHKTYSEINHIIHEVTGFLESQLNNKQVSLTLDLEEDLPPVLADIIQIEQVLINLLKNAIEAMSDIEKPLIIVSTRRCSHKFIELCVIDSGHGISKDKLKRIFNPFFTTKTSGMGMGLSISSSIIETHDGKLYAENNSEQGARFCLTLPISEEPPGNNNE